MIHIDQKVTTWKRFSFEKEYREELEKFLKENPNADVEDIFNWAYDNNIDPYCEALDGTEAAMSPEENGGHQPWRLQATTKSFTTTEP